MIENVYDSMDVWGTDPEGDVPISISFDDNANPNSSQNLIGAYMAGAENHQDGKGEILQKEDNNLVERNSFVGKELLVGHKRLFVGVGVTFGMVFAGYEVVKYLKKRKLKPLTF